MNKKIAKIFVATSSSIIDYSEIINEYSFKNFNVEIKYNDTGRKLNSNELIDKCFDCVGVIAGTEKYDNSVLNKLKNLKTISRMGVGTDNIDLNFAKTKNIKIFKTDVDLAPAVAELTLGLIIDLARKISYHSQNLKNNIWKKEMGFLLSGKTLGIIGLGSIGKELVMLSKGFNFKILAFDEYEDQWFSMKNDVKYCSLDYLISNSDIVSIHLALSKSTENLINGTILKTMKKKSILINTSRGEVLDESALYRLLEKNLIFGAGLDVYKNEPYNGPFQNLNNVVHTQHIGSYAEEIRIDMENQAGLNLLKGLKTNV